MKISVCMIVRNEEDVIERALQSIPPAFEKVIVDTGSTDSTVEIAGRLGAEVSFFEWCNDFSAARNTSINQASGDYILIMDADEELYPDVEETIHTFISDHPGMPGSILIHNLIGDEVHKHRMVRLFPNNGCFSYHGNVHETLFEGDQEAEAVNCEVKINHYGYQDSLYDSKEKRLRYETLYKEHLTKNPNDAYMYYQLGKLYYSLHEFQDAYEAFIRSYQFGQLDRLYFPPMLVMFGYTLRELGLSKEALELLAPYVRQYPAFPDLPFLIGLLAMDTGDLPYIEQSFKQALQIGETDKYKTVSGVGSFKAAYNLGVFYEVTGNTEEARRYYEISARYNDKASIERLKMLTE